MKYTTKMCKRVYLFHSLSLGDFLTFQLAPAICGWSFKQNLSLNLRYTHFIALLLVEILEQTIKILKNELSIILRWQYVYRIGPWSPSWRAKLWKTNPEFLLSLRRHEALLLLGHGLLLHSLTHVGLLALKVGLLAEITNILFPYS